MASGNNWSIDVVGVLSTLDIGAASNRKYNAGSTFEGGMVSICLGINLFYPGVWCSISTLVSKRNILQRFCFWLAVTGTILLNISRRSVAAMIVWSPSEFVGVVECYRNSFWQHHIVQSGRTAGWCCCFHRRRGTGGRQF